MSHDFYVVGKMHSAVLVSLNRCKSLFKNHLKLFWSFCFWYVQPSYPGGLNNPAFGSKQSSFNQLEASINQGSNDSWADGSDETGLQESYPKWMQVELFSLTFTN